MSDLRITPDLAGVSAPGARDETGAEGAAFGERLTDLVRDADAQQRVAEARVRERAQGEGSMVETMVALSKADTKLRFVVQLRNRALEAYQEIMRLPV